MKSKPPNKKLKIEPPGSESSSSSSNNSSSRPEVFNSATIATVKASMAATASEILCSNNNNNAKLGASLLSKESVTSSGSARNGNINNSNVSFPTLRIHDLSNVKDFPHFATCLTNTAHNNSDNSPGASESNSEVICAEDVDILQQELEILWSDASLRRRTVQKEQESLFGPSDHHRQSSDKTVGLGVKPGPTSPLSILTSCKSVSGPSSSRPLVSGGSQQQRKTTNGISNGREPSINNLDKTPKKLKNDPDAKSKRSNEKSSRSVQKRTNLNNLDGFSAISLRQAPNQFWDYANNYCRELTEDDLETLEKVMEEQKLSQELFEIPCLGPHFKDSPSECAIRCGRDRIETRSQDVCGPLTQRLVAALVDSRISAYRREQCLELYPDPTNGFFLSRPDLLSKLGLDGERRGSQPLETRLRQILLEQGLLIGEEADSYGDDPRDEILADIKKTQNHLVQLHQHNSDRLNHLHGLAKKELDRRGAKTELDRADRELLEAYRVITASRTKKKPLSKREREVAVRALENRRNALEKLFRPGNEAALNGHSSQEDCVPTTTATTEEPSVVSSG